MRTNDHHPTKPLRNIADIRRFFLTNEIPIYFVGATNFNLLGLDEWVKGLKYIDYIDCFDGQHPNVFVPDERPHEVFQSIEEITNYLLEHKEVADYINRRGPGGKMLALMFDERTEELARELKLEMCFPPAALRQRLDSKIVTTQIASEAGVASVPYVLTRVESYQALRELTVDLGQDLVIQTPFGDSGHTTFFISHEEDWNKYAAEIIKEPIVKVMKCIHCQETAIEACVTRYGTIVTPLMTELVGFPELTPYKGGWCGDEIFPNAFTKTIRRKAQKMAFAIGERLKQEGYRGYFELDLLIDQDNDQVYLGELNPRFTGASSLPNHAVFALADAPLFLFHLLEWFDVDYKISIRQLNQRWARPENIDSWSQMVIKHTANNLEIVTKAPPTGIWRMDNEGNVHFSRYSTYRRAVESEAEAFFLRISNVGDYQYEGADMGILVTRGRLMTPNSELNERARAWIRGIRAQFATIEVPAIIEIHPVEEKIVSFKMV
jgi:D-alanine-D-alanine ligase-like ATP-grasp enzyme